jgi:hypothetical protein
MSFESGFDDRGMPTGKCPSPPSHGVDGPGPETKPAERPGVPAPATDHGNVPAPKSGGVRKGIRR